MSSACAAANTNESRPSQPRHPGASRGPSRTAAQARAWSRGSRPLAANKSSVPINTMDPGFRRGGGRERARKAATPSLWRVGYPRNTPQLMVVESARAGRDSFATSPPNRLPRESGDPGAGRRAPAPRKGSVAHPGSPPARGSGEWRSDVSISSAHSGASRNPADDPAAPRDKNREPHLQPMRTTPILGWTRLSPG
jgi:hypothetical protein